MTSLAYFDNAATTWPKPDAVYTFADQVYRGVAGSAGRGSGAGSVSASGHSLKAKANLRKILGCPTHDIAFTASATDALNRVLFGIDLHEGDHVYATPLEHNAVTRPLHHLETAHGIEVHKLRFNSVTLLPEMDAIRAEFERHTPRAVIATHASNVCGAIVPFHELFTLAKEYGALTVLDMSQTAGLVQVNLAAEPVDFAVFAGHKTLYGPFGIGGIVCPRGSRLKPVLYGGNGIDSANQDMPENIVSMIEVGSQNLYAVAGLEASTDWILNTGTSVMRSREEERAARLRELLATSPNIRTIGASMECDAVGVVSTVFDGYAPDEIGMVLDRMGITVRSGLHCAPWAHAFLGTMPAGTVRFSVNATTPDEAFCVLENSLAEIREG